jgi:hypothetical protein
LALVLTTGCGRKDKQDAARVSYEDGILTRHNPCTPAHGTMTLALRETFRLAADPDHSQYFGRFQKDHIGNLYIMNPETASILKFSPEGSYQLEFGRKGEGPGEFKNIKTFRVFDDQMVVWGSRKIALFDLTGRLLKETKVKKYYYPVTIIEPDRFIANFFIESGGGADYRRERICAMIDSHEQVITTYFRGEGLGNTVIRKKNFTFSFSSSDITRDVRFAHNSISNRLYFFFSDRYRVQVKDLAGKPQMVFTCPWENRKIEDVDARKIVKMFRNLSPDQEEMIISNLPERLCALSGMMSLPSGHLLTVAIRGAGDYQMHLFDPQGVFLCILQYPDGIDLHSTRFFDQKIAGILESPEGDVYIEYAITNYDSIFQ